MTNNFLARRLLDLQAAYTNYSGDEAALASLGLAPNLTKDDIAAEYAQTLRELLAD